jgi:hypothetical protein
LARAGPGARSAPRRPTPPHPPRPAPPRPAPPARAFLSMGAGSCADRAAVRWSPARTLRGLFSCPAGSASCLQQFPFLVVLQLLGPQQLKPGYPNKRKEVVGWNKPAHPIIRLWSPGSDSSFLLPGSAFIEHLVCERRDC